MMHTDALSASKLSLYLRYIYMGPVHEAPVTPYWIGEMDGNRTKSGEMR